jgi:hypothetical protein
MPKDRFVAFMNWTYLISITVAVFSGFGNMPLYGRYYVADIPGLGWSRDFYINLYIHYVSGAVILMVSTYAVSMYLQQRRMNVRLTVSGLLRSLALGLLLFTGVLSALKNLAFINLPHAGLMTLAFAHLGSTMIFLFISIVCKITGKPWVIHDSVNGPL